MSDRPAPTTVVPRLPLTSEDALAAKYDALKALFPMAVTDGKVDLEKLRAVMGESAASGPERYGLSWAGKSDALKVLRQQTAATLLPAPSESVRWDETGNVIIEGDNLEVLKTLQHAYHGRVKLIYIDPPYNTGGDFIYPDDYSEGLASYQTFTRQVSEEGYKLTTNVNTSGRFHSRWLTMIYPRLFLARNLLREDGVIFVSIDDNEVHNLRLVMDEVFGEENFLATLVFDKNRKNDAKFFSVGHEYMLCYTRNRALLNESGTVFRAEKIGVEEVREVFEKLRDEFADRWDEIRDELKRHYATWSNEDPRKPLARYNLVDERGPYRDDKDISWPGGGGPTYDVFHPKTGKPCKVPKRGWVFSTKTRMDEKIAQGQVVFGADETTVPTLRTNLFESTSQVMRSVVFSYAQTAAQEFAKIFPEPNVFQNPKPIGDIKSILAYLTADDDLILDFFAGSGTTAHATMELNKEDGGNRKFILVQLPEPTGRKDFLTIAEITKERVRRVIAKMENENAGELALASGAKLDCGFKVFKLAPSNFAVWDPTLAPADAAGLAKQWEFSADNVRGDAQEQALLYELMLKCGLPLSAPVVTASAGGARVYCVDEARLAICLERVLTREILRALIELKPQSVLCLDIGFKGNDALKVNAQLEFQSHDIQFRTA